MVAIHVEIKIKDKPLKRSLNCFQSSIWTFSQTLEKVLKIGKRNIFNFYFFLVCPTKLDKYTADILER